MPGEIAKDRRLLQVDGKDAKPFLQNLITNDMSKLSNGLVYSALLTPQGKFVADFFVVPYKESLLLDVHEEMAEDIFSRLSLYRMRAAIKLEFIGAQVRRGLGAAPSGAYPDPRHSSLGWRSYGESEPGGEKIDWNEIRVASCIPESCIELIPGSTFILEAGFERLNGVDFAKGCYVGQEVTARMKHKAKLRKGLAKVEIRGSAKTGDPVLANGRQVGEIHTVSGNLAIAYLRFDQLKDFDLQAGDSFVSVLPNPKRILGSVG